ncbi:MAG: flippase-like domain-containing protein [Rhodospirillales bacterium]|nr:flippase-like domain-containing protein [Rhodospirillales bacterium]
MLKKTLAILLKVAVSAALIWYLLKDIDAAAAQARLQDVNPLLLLLGVVVFYFQLLIGAFRWQAVNRAIGAALSFAQAVRIFFIGMFFNQALPGGTGGDAVRVYLAYKGGLELRCALNGVMLERVAAVVALILLVDLAQPFLQLRIDAKAANLALSSAVFLTFAAVGGIALIMSVDRFFQAFQKYRIVRGLSYLSTDTRAVFLNLKNAFAVVAWGVVGNVNISICVFILAQSLGLDISVVDCLMLVPPVLLIVAIPISVGGWGVRETAMVTAFGLVGVPGEGALVLSILVGLVGLAISLPGGLVWLLSRERGQGATLDEIETEIAVKETVRS